MKKRLLFLILILMVLVSRFICATSNEPKTLVDILKDALDKRRTVLKDESKFVQESEQNWDDEDIDTDKEPNTFKPIDLKVKVEDSEKIGKEGMASRAAAIGHLFGSNKTADKPVQAASEKKAADGKPDITPMGKRRFDEMKKALLQAKGPVAARSEQKTKVEVQETRTTSTSKQPVVKTEDKKGKVAEQMPALQQIEQTKTEQNGENCEQTDILPQKKNSYKNKMSKFIAKNSSDAAFVNQLESLSEEGAKEAFYRFNQARFMTEILGFAQELHGNKFLLTSALTTEEKEKIQNQALVDLINSHSGEVLSIVENLLPERFFVENNKCCVITFGIKKQKFHPDFTCWYKVLADDEFYKNNSYQVERVFYLIDRSFDLMTLIKKDSKNAAVVSLYKKELEFAVAELRWLWIIVDMMKNKENCEKSKVSLQYHCASRVFIEMIKNCLIQVQNFVEV